MFATMKDRDRIMRFAVGACGRAGRRVGGNRVGGNRVCDPTIMRPASALM
jgi:hypothetical protein